MIAEPIRDRAQLDLLAAEWNALLQRSRADTIFLTWEWIHAWLRTIGREVRLNLMAVRDGQGALRAIAPFYDCDLKLFKMLPYRCLCVLGDQASGSEYLDIIADPPVADEAIGAVTHSMRSQSPRFDCIWIPRVAGWTDAPQRLVRGFGADHWCMHRREKVFSSMELPGSVDGVWQLFATKMRTNIRRQQKQIDGKYKKHFYCLQNGHEILEVLPRFIELHQKRWESAGLPGAFRKSPRLQEFYGELCRTMNQTGWLRMSIMELDGEMAAMQFGLTYRGIYQSLQEGFEPEINGVGNVLRLEAINQCVRDGLSGYDFLGGFTAHKRQWGAQPRTGYDYFIQKRSLKTWPLRVRELWPTGRYVSFTHQIPNGDMSASPMDQPEVSEVEA